MSLYLHGSRSPFLSEGMNLLTSLAESNPDTMLGARLASRIAPSIGEPFFRIDKNKLKMTHDAEPERALKLTDPAVALYSGLSGSEAKALNISYSKLVQGRAKLLVEVGKKAKAKKELSALRQDLAGRDVKEPVLKDLKAFEDAL